MSRREPIIHGDPVMVRKPKHKKKKYIVFQGPVSFANSLPADLFGFSCRFDCEKRCFSIVF